MLEQEGIKNDDSSKASEFVNAAQLEEYFIRNELYNSNITINATNAARIQQGNHFLKNSSDHITDMDALELAL